MVYYQKKKKIGMLTHSMLSILIQLVFQVDVLVEHIPEGRTVTSVKPSQWLGTELGNLIDIHHGTLKPKDNIITVKYRDL